MDTVPLDHVYVPQLERQFLHLQLQVPMVCLYLEKMIAILVFVVLLVGMGIVLVLRVQLRDWWKWGGFEGNLGYERGVVR
jgi:hypothetical protein